MGSYAEATMIGFICRLCSEQKKCVIHFYSKKSKEMEIMQKLKLLPISIDMYDNLPKTICHDCIHKLNEQYNLITRIRRSFEVQRRHRIFHSNGRCPDDCPLYNADVPGLEIGESSSSTNKLR